MSEQEQEGSPKQSTINLVLAVLITAGVVWFAKGGHAPNCVYDPDQEAPANDCSIPYYVWEQQAFPNQPYIDEFHLSVEDTQLFEACTGAMYATHDSVIGWAFDVEDSEVAGRAVNVPERVLDACRTYLANRGL